MLYSKYSSQIKLNSNKYYDGIVALYHDHDLYFTKPHASAILFNSIIKSSQEKTIKCDLFIDPNEIPTQFISKHEDELSFDFIYHSATNNVIYTFRRGLYEIKLKDIDLTENEKPKFNVDILSDKIENKFGSIRDWWIGEIYNSNKCFALIDPYRNQIEIKCGIFDLANKTWTKGKPLYCNKYIKPTFGICRNNYHITNIVYVTSDRGHTAKYDINKSCWSMLDESICGHETSGKPLIWMDEENPYILHCVDIREKHGWTKSYQFDDIYQMYWNEQYEFDDMYNSYWKLDCSLFM